MDNVLTQWVKENTRFRTNEESSRQDLLFTKEPEITEDLNYRTLIGKSDHILLEFGIKEGMEEGRSLEDHNANTMTMLT